MNDHIEETLEKHRTHNSHHGKTDNSEEDAEDTIVESVRVAQALEALSQRTDYIVSLVSPNKDSEEFRLKIFTFISKLINIVLPDTLIVPYGSFISKVYLPSSDLDICCYNHSADEIPLLQRVLEALAMFSDPKLRSTGIQVPPAVHQLIDSHISVEERLEVENLEFIMAKVSLIKCTVCGLGVDISAAQPGSLVTSLFIEKLAQSIGRDNLLKRSFLLIQSWCLYEARIVGGHSQMLSSYALRVMIINILLNCKDIYTPFQALYVFLAYYSNFNYERNIIHLSGPLQKPPAHDSLSINQLTKNMDVLEACISPSYLSYLQFLRDLCGGTLYKQEVQNVYEIVKTHFERFMEAQEKPVERLGDPETDEARSTPIDDRGSCSTQIDTISPIETIRDNALGSEPTNAGLDGGKCQDTTEKSPTNPQIKYMDELAFSNTVLNANDFTPVIDLDIDVPPQREKPSMININDGDSMTSLPQSPNINKLIPIDIRKRLSIPISLTLSGNHDTQEEKLSSNDQSSNNKIETVSYDPVLLKGLTNMSRSILSYFKSQNAFNEPHLKDSDILLLLKQYFLTNTPTDIVLDSRVFLPSYISIVDPLQITNNLGRSVSEHNFMRITRSFQTAYTVLSHIVQMCVTGNITITEALAEYDCFFISTLSIFGDMTIEKANSYVSDLSVNIDVLEAGCHLVGATVLGFPIDARSSLIECLQINCDN